MALSRRNLLQIAAAGGVSGLVLALVGGVGRARELPRPPGALVEDHFLARCSRCNRCVDVCQPLALRPAGFGDGLANVGTPVLDVTECVLCMECIRTCPTGALKKVPKAEVDLGTAVINKELCLGWLKKRRCRDCEKACPLDAIKLEKGRFPVVDEKKCNGCGICVRRCPTTPKAVLVSYQGALRFDPSQGRFVAAVEDRVGPYEFPPPEFSEWFSNRLRTLAERIGLLSRGG